MTVATTCSSVGRVQDNWQAMGFATAVCAAVLVGAVLVLAALRPVGRSLEGSSLVLLVVLLLASLVVLSAGQSEVAVGLEVAVLGLGLGIATGTRALADDGRGPRWRLLAAMLPAAGLVVGGILLETDDVSGFTWSFAAVALGLALAVERAWAMATAHEHG